MASPKASTIIVAGIIVSLLIGGAIVLLKPHDYSYNGFPFNKAECPNGKNDCWTTTLQLKGELRPVTFYYHPKDLESISVPREVLALPNLAGIANSTLYLAIPQNAPGKVSVAAVQIARFLGTKNNVFNINTKAAIYGYDADEVNCDTANGRTVILSFEQGVNDSVYIRSTNCIIAQAVDDEHAVMVAEALSYHLLGVMPTYTYQFPKNNSTTKTTNATLL